MRIVRRTSPTYTMPTYVIQYKSRWGRWKDRHGEFPTQADAEGTVADILRRDEVVRTYN